MVFYGVQLEVKVKMQIQNKPDRGIRYLKIFFKKYDANGNGKLDIQKLEK